MTSRKNAKKGYIHGYERVEQRRLIKQANFLEPFVYKGVDFQNSRRILEIGCGVGAQTKILLRRFPRLRIDAVDVSEEQLKQAKRYLRKEISQGRVRLIQSDAADLRAALGSERYDGAFICWFLEHVPQPLKVLRSARHYVQAGAPIFLSEVFNQSFFTDPSSSTLEAYWRHFNEQQARMGGDPQIGVKLGGLLKQAGFRKIESALRSLHFDARDPSARKKFVNYFEELVLSGAPALQASKRVDAKSVASLKREFARLRVTPDSVIHLGFFRAQALA